MVPASPLRIRRLRLGLSLFEVGNAVGSDAITISLVERDQAKRPELRAKLTAFYQQRERAAKKVAS